MKVSVSTGLWFKSGRAAGEASSRQRAHGLPFVSMEESWRLATAGARTTDHRWRQFTDGWLKGFLDSPERAGGRTPSPFGCGTAGEECAKPGVVLIDETGKVLCAANALQYLLRQDSALRRRNSTCAKRRSAQSLHKAAIRFFAVGTSASAHRQAIGFAGMRGARP